MVNQMKIILLHLNAYLYYYKLKNEFYKNNINIHSVMKINNHNNYNKKLP